MSVMKVTNSNYTQEVLESNVPVLIDFFADWCMPCKMFAPIVDEVAAAHEGKVKVVKINIDDDPGTGSGVSCDEHSDVEACGCKRS
ncbi:MAG: thioredoxin family protein [Coprococcus phoceensis]